MLIGVPREIKRDEYRVAMLPVGVEELTRAGHQVLIEAGRGRRLGHSRRGIRRRRGGDRRHGRRRSTRGPI